jgi:hypothetical protein
MMEERGLATVVIGLIRHQMEVVRPPRGLWTPFQLGRPLGEPENPAFQRRVLTQALKLLERTDGPVILEDFPDDPPGWSDQPGWQPPFVAEALDEQPAGMTLQFDAELARLRPFWEAARQRYGRTTVGLSGQRPNLWPGFVAAVLGGQHPVVPPQTSMALSLRYLCDDIRAMYSEAAQSAGPAPASRQNDAWYWRSTIAGQLVIALRSLALASDDEQLRTVGTRFMVPTMFLPVTPAG